MPMATEDTLEKEERPRIGFRVPYGSVREDHETRNGETSMVEETQPFLDNPIPDKEEKPTDLPLKIPELLKDGLELGATTSKLGKAFSLIQNNSITLRNLVVAAATYGLERLLNAEAFTCPANGHEKYGFAYLLAPVFILFCANLIVIGDIWKLSSRMYIKRYRRRGDCVARVLPSLLKACVGPAVWLIVAFQDGDYFVCAIVGPIPPLTNSTSAEEIAGIKREAERCKSQSLLLSWIVLVIIVFLGTAMIVWKHCFLKDNLLMKNLYEFERREALSAMKTFTERMKGKETDSDDEIKTEEYGREDEKVQLYEDGIPEMMGRKTVEKMFQSCDTEDWTDGHTWHYVKAYKSFSEMYPRISTGDPLDPWRVVQGDRHEERTQNTCRFKWLPTCFEMRSTWDELRPLNLGDMNPNVQRAPEREITESPV